MLFSVQLFTYLKVKAEETECISSQTKTSKSVVLTSFCAATEQHFGNIFQQYTEQQFGNIPPPTHPPPPLKKLIIIYF